MTKFKAIAAASVIGLSMMAATQPASARDGAIAAGVVGGLAAGAIIGSQANRSYYNGPAYVEPSYAPVYGACHIERQEVEDGYGRVRIRRVRVCD
jgi:hypothetical protein